MLSLFRVTAPRTQAPAAKPSSDRAIRRSGGDAPVGSYYRPALSLFRTVDQERALESPVSVRCDQNRRRGHIREMERVCDEQDVKRARCTDAVGSRGSAAAGSRGSAAEHPAAVHPAAGSPAGAGGGGTAGAAAAAC